MRKLRIATIGVGPSAHARSSSHIDTIVKLHDHYELCAFCDRSEQRLQEAGEAYGIKAQYTRLDSMLAQEKPDVVIRLTPKDSTVPLCLTVLEAGVHLINEIPIASTLPQADALIDAAARNHVKMEIAENVWVWPEEQLKRRIARAGLLGTITHGRFNYPCGTYHGLSTIRKILGCDPVRALGIDGEHTIDPSTYLDFTGRERTLCKWEAGVFQFPGAPGEPGPINILYEMPTKGRRHVAKWEIEGTGGHLDGDALFLYRDLEEIEIPFRYDYEAVGDEQVISRLWVDTDPLVEWINPFVSYRVGSSGGARQYGVSGKDEIARACILDSLYRAVVDDAEPDYGHANARKDLEAWIAVRESAWRGNQWVDLPITELTSVEKAIHKELICRYGHDPIADREKLLETTYVRGGVLWDLLGWL